MRAVVTWFRIDVRSRVRSLLVLALLVAFATGTVMTAVAGARRGASAVDRLEARTLPTTIVVLPNQPGFDWEAIRRLPEVAGLTEFVVGDYSVDEIPPGNRDNALGFPPADDEVMRTIERPIILQGRVADPDRADEVVVSANFEDTYGRGVGDTVTLRLFTPAEVDASATGEALPARPGGPAIKAEIVGVVRSPWFSDPVGPDAGALVPSPGLYADYGPNLVGTKDSAFINALVRLDRGEADIARFKADLARESGRKDIDVWNTADMADHAREVTRFEANSLLAFALAAGLAALFLVGQSVARYAASTVVDLEVLRAVGLTPRQTRVAATLGPALAAMVGSGFGAASALVASRWFPMGSAARYEPVPGIDVDALVVGVGILVVPLLVAAAAAWAAAVRPAEAGSRRPVIAAASRARLPAPMAIGARFALERGRGRQALPVRPALVGAVIGVLGTIAALTFARGIGDAAEHPERFGQTYQFATYLGFNGEDFGPVDEVLAGVDDDDDVVAVNDTRIDVAQAAGVAVEIFSFDPVGAPIETVATRGRMPDGRGEIAVAPRTAEAMGVSVGDEVVLKGSRGRESARVTGLAFVPQGPHNDYATGAWTTRATYDALFDGFKFHVGLVAVREGADPSGVASRWQKRGVELEPPGTLSEVAELEQVRGLPLFLAGFLALLALGAVGHALATAVRRRHHDLAAMRAVGMTGFQIRSIVLTQATILALFGVLVGVPLGLALGRSLWRYVAENTPVQYLPPVAVLALIVIAPLALLLANLLAAVPSQRAASMDLARALRTE